MAHSSHLRGYAISHGLFPVSPNRLALFCLSSHDSNTPSLNAPLFKVPVLRADEIHLQQMHSLQAYASMSFGTHGKPAPQTGRSVPATPTVPTPFPASALEPSGPAGPFPVTSLLCASPPLRAGSFRPPGPVGVAGGVTQARAGSGLRPDGSGGAGRGGDGGRRPAMSGRRE